MKNLLKIGVAIGFLTLARVSPAWQPAGWVYHQSPYAYSLNEAGWHYLNGADNMWCYAYAGAQWRQLSTLSPTWIYFNWPHGYVLRDAAWYWLNIEAQVWSFDFSTLSWSRFGAEDMVFIPSGSNVGTDPDFGPYSLTVDSFYMDKHEVTKALWDEVRTWNGGNGYTDLYPAIGKAPNHPVHSVYWYHCVKWCNARSQKEGRTPVYYTDPAMTQVYKTGQVLEPYVKASANGYRLPTDAQWEYAARGGTVSRRFPWGDSDTIQHGRANYYSSSGYSYDTSPTRGHHPTYATGIEPYTSPVGSFAANGYGLCDMAGNVGEWCYDWHPDYVGSRRVERGGVCYGDASGCRVGARQRHYPSDGPSAVGFRAVLPSGQ